MVGLSFGKGVALARGLPLVGGQSPGGPCGFRPPGRRCSIPFLLLLVSGGHCQLLSVQGRRRLRAPRHHHRRRGRRGLRQDRQGPGPGLSRRPGAGSLAETGDASRFTLPRALLGRKDCDFSFSGLKTAAALIAHAEVRTEQDRADLAAGVQAAIARQLAERTDRAMKLFTSKTTVTDPAFVVAGGVAANQAVRAALTATAETHGFVLHAPPLAYCTDNAAMIALAGAEHMSWAGCAS